MKTAPYLHKTNSEAFTPVSHNILYSLLKGQNKTCVLSLVFNGYLLCTDRPGHVLGVLGPHTHRHTKRECKMRLYIQKLGERDFCRAWGNFTEEAESKLGLG